MIRKSLNILIIFLFFGCQKEIEIEKLTLFVGDNYEFELPYKSSKKYYYIWDFGDGTMSEKENPTYSYNESGFYNVVLGKYSKSGGLISTQTIYNVFVKKQYYPRIDFQYYIPPFDKFKYFYTNQEYKFLFNLSNGQRENFDNLSFNMVIDENKIYNNQLAYHTFSTSGEHTLKLEIKDQYGNSSTLDTSILVGGLNSDINISIPNSQTSSIGSITERYLIVYTYSDSRRAQTIPDIYGYDNTFITLPLIQNGKLRSPGGDYSEFYPLYYTSINSINDNDVINFNLPSIGFNQYSQQPPQDLDDLYIIVVQVGSLGKAIGHKRIRFTPGLISNHELDLDFVSY